MHPNELIWQIAVSKVGLREIPGRQHDPLIVQFFEDIGTPWFDDDETHWCAAFVSWVLLHANCKIHPQAAKRVRARALLEIGRPVTNPRIGDIVVLKRGAANSTAGHGGFYGGMTDKGILTLAGNTSNRVKIALEPFSDLLGYRRAISNVI